MTRPEPGSEFLAIATLRPQCDYVKVPRCFFNRWECTVSHVMVMSPQVSWLFFKAVRAGLAVKRPYLDSYGPSEQRGKTANRPRPGGRVARRLRIDSDMRPPRALPAAHFERNDVIIICETVH